YPMKHQGLDRDAHGQVKADLWRLIEVIESNRGALALRSADLSDDNVDLYSRLDAITTWLYSTWYTSGDDGETSRTFVDDHRALATLLRVSHPAFDRWQQGWVILQYYPDGSCLVGCKHQRRELRPGAYANLSRRGLPPVPGDSVAVTELVDWVDDQTGFW